MSTATVPITDSLLQREVLRFLEMVQERSACEISFGQRQESRYQRTWPLVVATQPTGGDNSFAVALHNASSSGVGFLCQRALPVGGKVYLQLFWHAVSPLWVPATVRHVTRIPHGILIGCEFALDTDEDPNGFTPSFSPRFSRTSAAPALRILT